MWLNYYPCTVLYICITTNFNYPIVQAHISFYVKYMGKFILIMVLYLVYIVYISILLRLTNTCLVFVSEFNQSWL